MHGIEKQPDEEEIVSLKGREGYDEFMEEDNEVKAKKGSRKRKTINAK
jgi:hypothetical protein